MFTVTFRNSYTDQFEISRHCTTLRMARSWAKWLVQQKFVAQVVIYRGPAGGTRVDTLFPRPASLPKGVIVLDEVSDLNLGD
jgi:hypothetical protein